jgi:hypothetical protein
MRITRIAAGTAVLAGLGAAAVGLGAGQAAADKDGIWIPLPPPGHIGQIVGIPPGHIGQIVGVPPGQWDKGFRLR